MKKKEVNLTGRGLMDQDMTLIYLCVYLDKNVCTCTHTWHCSQFSLPHNSGKQPSVLDACKLNTVPGPGADCSVDRGALFLLCSPAGELAIVSSLVFPLLYFPSKYFWHFYLKVPPLNTLWHFSLPLVPCLPSYPLRDEG